MSRKEVGREKAATFGKRAEETNRKSSSKTGKSLTWQAEGERGHNNQPVKEQQRETVMTVSPPNGFTGQATPHYGSLGFFFNGWVCSDAKVIDSYVPFLISGGNQNEKGNKKFGWGTISEGKRHFQTCFVMVPHKEYGMYLACWDVQVKGINVSVYCGW